MFDQVLAPLSNADPRGSHPSNSLPGKFQLKLRDEIGFIILIGLPEREKNV